MRNGKGDEVPFSWRDLRCFVGSYARPELPRRDAGQALEVMGELALVTEAGVGGHLRQGEVASGLQELLGIREVRIVAGRGPSVVVHLNRLARLRPRYLVRESAGRSA